MANISNIRLSGTTYTIVDSTAIHSLVGYSTTAEMNQAITAATSALAQTIEEMVIRPLLMYRLQSKGRLIQPQ